MEILAYVLFKTLDYAVDLLIIGLCVLVAAYLLQSVTRND